MSKMAASSSGALAPMILDTDTLFCRVGGGGTRESARVARWKHGFWSGCAGEARVSLHTRLVDDEQRLAPVSDGQPLPLLGRQLRNVNLPRGEGPG